MRLSVDFGDHGFNEECETSADAIKKLESIVDDSIIEIIIRKTAGVKGGPSGSKDVL